jgi:hypothetical protein
MSAPGMKDSVRAAFPALTDKLEGFCDFMYTDNVGLVTTGRGDLIDYGRMRRNPGDPIVGSDSKAAEILPWQNSCGGPATRPEIHDAWSVVKNAWPKVQSTDAKHLTTIRLTHDAINTLSMNRLDQMWGDLLKKYATLPEWCADAQMGIVFMSWAMGPDFNFPNFSRAAKTGDWLVCAGPPGDANKVLTARGQAWMRDGSPGQLTPNLNYGLRARNLAVKTLFTNAFYSQDKDVLYYPQALPLSGAV